MVSLYLLIISMYIFGRSIYYYLVEFQALRVTKSNTWENAIRDKHSETTNTKTPDLIDVLFICWGIVLIIYIGNETWSKWVVKSEYIITELVLLFFGLIYLNVRKFSHISMFRWRPIPLQLVIPCLLIAFSGAVLLDELDRLIGLIIPVPVNELALLEQSFSSVSAFDTLLIILGVVIIAPITEESLFRGFIQQVFEIRWDITKAVLIASAVFALIHFQPWWAIQQLILAVFMGYLAWRWNSIIPAALIHAANNLWALRHLLNLGYGEAGFYDWNEHVNPLIIVIAAIIFFKSFRFSEVLYERLVKKQAS
jgi:membrane protease YdiL (CAAX protease family)